MIGHFTSEYGSVEELEPRSKHSRAPGGRGMLERACDSASKDGQSKGQTGWIFDAERR